MIRCPKCSRDSPDGSRFCNDCGASLPETDTPTATSAPEVSSFDSADRGRFVPGAMIAERYRIVGLIGRGGMGEVYRADDLKLGQTVALKFLPQAIENDPHRLERFHNEVRVALRVTHPNVCRVHDIGEVDGRHYISMEYIDGEDLASLLRRIGRLPGDKAVQIARQLCAGLAAAHDEGILHRDLKPANVMIDGRGRARITDFGLAGLAEGFEGAELHAGTPRYMAPEQRQGQGVSVRSDLYSLGLVLYELFTGKPAFGGKTAAEMARLQLETTPTSPSSHIDGIDPAAEAVILRCLEKEPADRPATALNVAAALPGGDPLAAALAAGETPSPEMVAEAGGKGALRPAIAVSLLVFSLAGLALGAWLIGKFDMLGRVSMDKPPQALVERAHQIIERFGYTDPPVDSEHGFDGYSDIVRYIREHDSSPTRWDRLSTDLPTAVLFWYRQSPHPMVPEHEEGRVWNGSPWPSGSGMINLSLGTGGRLRAFRAMPPQLEAGTEDAVDPPAPDWNTMFDEAGLAIDSFTPTEPRWTADVYCDTRAAWTGTYPDQPQPKIRIEACTYRGRPVFFDVLHPWNRAARDEPFVETARDRAQQWIRGLVFLGTLIGGGLLARRNLRLGRGDRRSAFRLALFVILMHLGAWLFQASHVSNLNEETDVFLRNLGSALFDGLMIWVMYVALEPFVRRRWPESIVSWSRLIAGRLRDPLVGRHLLFGCALGVGMILMGQAVRVLPPMLGQVGDAPRYTDLDTLLGTRFVIGELFWAVRHAVRIPMASFFLLVLLRYLLRNSGVALAVWVALYTFLMLPSSTEHVWIWIAYFALGWTAVGLFVMRFGLVALLTVYLIQVELGSSQPLTLDLSTWYAGSSLIALLFGAALILFAFYTSLGGRSLFGDDVLPAGQA